MKVLITGCTGYLGSFLASHLSAHQAFDVELLGVARRDAVARTDYPYQSLDISNEAEVAALVDHHKPDVILHTAALNPGADESAMDAVNYLGALHIAKAAKQHACRLVAMSSDVVHNGIDAPFADDAKPTPLAENPYSVSKARGELAMLEHYPQAVVIRTSLIYGLASMDRGTEVFVERLRRGEGLTLYADVLRQPVCIEALTECICQLAFVHTEVSGTINVVGDDVLSRAEFARLLLGWWQVETHGLVNEVNAAGQPGLPVDLRMQTALARRLGLPTPGVKEVMAAGKKKCL